MGFNVGGIYVRAGNGIDQAAVARAIREYWKNLGARETKVALLERKPLSLENTGALSFAVFPARRSGDDTWVAVADSERYRADRALAADLARSLSTDVWFYEVTDSTNHGSAQRFGKGARTTRKAAEVASLVESLPFPFSYFDDLAKAPAAKRKGLVILGFEEIPHRPKAAYSGPSPKMRHEQDAAAAARGRVQALLDARDTKALNKLKMKEGVYDLVLAHVTAADLADRKTALFVAGLAHGFMGRPYSRGFWRYVEAAVRASDEAIQAAALSFVENTGDATDGEQHAIALAERGEKDVALRMLEVLTRTPVAASTVWNNAVHFLAALERPSLPAKRIEALLEGARAQAPANPAVFHNLACAYLRRGRTDDAVSCVIDAVKYGYEGIEALRTDPDLAKLRTDARFKAAFAKKRVVSPAHLVIVRASEKGKEKLRLVGPAIGFHLYFANRKAASALSGLVAELATEFPGMFAYCAPQDGLEPRKVAKGRVTRDIAALKQNKSTYGFELHYDRAPRRHARSASCSSSTTSMAVS